MPWSALSIGAVLCLRFAFAANVAAVILTKVQVGPNTPTNRWRFMSLDCSFPVLCRLIVFESFAIGIPCMSSR